MFNLYFFLSLLSTHPPRIVAEKHATDGGPGAIAGAFLVSALFAGGLNGSITLAPETSIA